MKITAYEVRPDERDDFIRIARETGVELTMVPHPLTHETLKDAAGSDGVTILGRTLLNRDLLTELRDAGIRFVSTRTIGCDHMDLDAAKELGISCANSGYAPDGVADYTVMLILMLLRNYKPALYRGNCNDYSLAGLQGREMRNLTFGIIGTGRIGSTVIRDLTGFGGKIVAYDPYPNEQTAQLATYVPLEELYKVSDVISLHLPITPQTHHLIDRAALAKMKKGVVLINCSRGELMDMNALMEGIETQQVGALGLDVFEHEAGIYHEDRRWDIIKNREMAYLRQFPNVIMTQHMAFYTDAAVTSMVECGIQALLQMASGAPCPYRVA